MGLRNFKTPFDEHDLLDLRVGDRVNLTGTIFTARDSAHKRMIDTIIAGGTLPFTIKNQIIYYVGPTPPKPNQVIGSAGPTTSERMDKYTPLLLELGLKGMIGKGKRNQEVKEAIVKHKAVYFAAVGGAGALIAKSIVNSEVYAYHDLGPEAIFKLQVKDFPLIVVNDSFGGNLYEEGEERYKL